MQSEPEVPAAEGFGEETAGACVGGGDEGKPVVGGGEESEDPAMAMMRWK